jgi:hypothetical protein
VLLPSLFLHGLATANLDGVPVLGMVGVLMLSTLLGAVLLVLYQGAANHDGADFTSVFQGGVRFNNYIGATLAAGIYGSAGMPWRRWPTPPSCPWSTCSACWCSPASAPATARRPRCSRRSSPTP